MKVAAFGSIAFPVSQAEYARLDALVSLRYTVLVSDADGADALIQEHLATLGYRDVVVYHNGCRNGLPRRNLGAWSTVLVPGAFHVKDARMCSDADAGLAFWNGFSRGTGRNIEQLRGEGKKVRVVTPAPAPAALRSCQDALYTALLNDADTSG